MTASEENDKKIIDALGPIFADMAAKSPEATQPGFFLCFLINIAVEVGIQDKLSDQDIMNIGRKEILAALSARR